MNPLYRHQLAQRYQPQAQQEIDAPTPWRMVFGLSELARIDDARGHAVTICRREVAERIVAAVNGTERGS